MDEHEFGKKGEAALEALRRLLELGDEHGFEPHPDPAARQPGGGVTAMHRTPAGFLLFCLAVGCLALGSAAGPQLPRASEVVEPRAYVSLEPVPRGRAFEVAVAARIRPGFHINAHKVSLDYLIPTTLAAELPQGVRALDTVYPPGVPRTFQFSLEKLSVYEGSVTLRMKLRALPDAPLGAQNIALTLRYQPCNDVACLPPVSKPVTAEFEIAPAGTPARPANRAIFELPRPKGQSLR